MATSSIMFMRIVGNSVGAAVFGAILNFGINRRIPEAGDAVNRLLEPAARQGLGAAEIARLSEAVASSLHYRLCRRRPRRGRQPLSGIGIAGEAQPDTTGSAGNGITALSLAGLLSSAATGRAAVNCLADRIAGFAASRAHRRHPRAHRGRVGPADACVQHVDVAAAPRRTGLLHGDAIVRARPRTRSTCPRHC